MASPPTLQAGDEQAIVRIAAVNGQEEADTENIPVSVAVPNTRQWNDRQVLALQHRAVGVVARQHSWGTIRQVLGQCGPHSLGDRDAMGDVEALSLHAPKRDHLSP